MFWKLACSFPGLGFSFQWEHPPFPFPFGEKNPTQFFKNQLKHTVFQETISGLPSTLHPKVLLPSWSFL
jgi:hypothetical protein